MRKTISVVLCMMILIGMIPMGVMAKDGEKIENIDIVYDYTVEENQYGGYNVNETIKIKNPEDGYLYAARNRCVTSDIYFQTSPEGKDVGTIKVPVAYESNNFWLSFSDDVLVIPGLQSGPIIEVVKIKKDNWNIDGYESPYSCPEIWEDKDCAVYGYAMIIRPVA